MPKDDFYSVLGVPRTAAADEIKRAYRKLAKQFHPDRNPNDPSAEKKFKRVQEAYSVLGDAEKRTDYDQFGQAGVGRVQTDPGGRKVYTWGEGQAVNVEDLEDLFSAFGDGGGGGRRPSIFDQIFSGRGERRRGRAPEAPSRGADITQEVSLSFEQAAFGTGLQLSLHGPDGKVQTLDVKIPPGVNDGQRIRVRGKGEPDPHGGEHGDLYLVCRIRPHPVFARDGANVLVTVPVSLMQAVLGGKIEVPTVDGSVTLTIPPGTSSGAKLRIKGKGVATPDGGRGDEIVMTRIVVPRELSPQQRELFESLRALETGTDGATSAASAPPGGDAR